jgi:hypothetical protein
MCIDQVEFMEKLVQPNELRARIHLWVEELTARKRINPKAAMLLDAILYRGQVPRGDVAQILGLSTRYSRDTVAELTKQGVVASDTPYGPLRIVFTAKWAPRWMPGLFPAEPR